MLRAVTSGAGDVRVRQLLLDDAASVAQLLGQLGYSAQVSELRDRIAAWTGDGRGSVFGASVADAVVGCAAVYVVPFFERTGARARLVALVVDARYRRRGVGALLVEHVRDFARRHGAVELEVTSRRERTDAERFYRGLGFADVTGRSRRYIAEL